MRHSLRYKMGLALGGGAARGMAHVGVLRVFHREQIPIDLIAGTSMGAIIGAAYAAFRDPDTLEQQVRNVLTSEEFKKNRLSFLKETKEQRGGVLFSVTNLIRKGIFFGVSNLRPSFLSAEHFADSLEAIVPEVEMDALGVPFGAVALDIESGNEVLIRSGNLRRAVAASSAIPGILPPVQTNDKTLIDGGWVDKIPVLPAFLMGADAVIAVDICADLEDTREFTRGVDIMLRANAIKDATLVAFQRRMADVVVSPAVGDVHWADFGAFERCIKAGEEAAEAILPRVRELMRHERLLSIVRPGSGRRLADLHLQTAGHEIKII